MALGSFTLSLEKFQIDTKQKAVRAAKKIAMEAFKRVIMRSPVDTGRFRANWGVSIGSPYTGSDQNGSDKSGDTTVMNSATVAAGWNAKKSIFLMNNLAYAVPLENGHSQQAPAGMVRLTIAELQNGAAEGAIK